MANDAKKLKQFTAQRAGEISQLLNLKAIADQAVNNTDVHSNFIARYKHIDDIFNAFKEFHQQIVVLVSTQDDGDLNAQTEIKSEFMNNYYDIQTIYSRIIKDTSHDNSTLNHSSVSSNSQFSSLKNVRLPKIELPKFDGEPKQWQTFIDMFDSLIHNNDQLNDIDKYNYLIASLQKEPLSIVKRTPLTGQNYLVAYNCLKKRFNNPRLIAAAHWHSIEQSKRLTQDTTHALRELIDTFENNLSLLDNVGFEVITWDFPLFCMLMDRLDPATATSFELEHGSTMNKGFYYATLISFLRKRCDAVDTVQLTFKSNSKPPKNSPVKSSVSKPTFSSALLSNTSRGQCQLCDGQHLIYSCPNFITLNSQERYNLIKARSWCSNCLGSRHSSQNCTSQSRCKKCSRKHHTLLHFDKVVQSGQASLTPNNVACCSKDIPPNDSTTKLAAPVTNLLSHGASTVLLSTLIVGMKDNRGVLHHIRALLDSGSQSNFISSKCASRLGLRRFNTNIAISGIAQMDAFSQQGVRSTIQHITKDDPVLSLDFLVIPNICSNMPEETLPLQSFSTFSHLQLADPHFHQSRPIDILLGAELVGIILTGNTLSSGRENPVALETVFGWVVMGKITPLPSINRISTFLASTQLSLESSVTRFWELESVPSAAAISPEDQLAERHFKETFKILENGRFQVELPFKCELPSFSGSRDIALRRFFSLEKRLSRDYSLRTQYHEFMSDYLESKHMSLIEIQDISNPSGYYIPHFCIIRPESATTKLRVVFDASTKDLNSVSLNDTLLTGPKLQNDLVAILIKFRLRPFVLTADIKQMYRQILIPPSQRHYQRILWRSSPDNPVLDYELNTVTYGVSSAPFMAIRTTHQLALEHKSIYPLASSALLEDTYIDDIVSGSHTLEEALKLQYELLSLLRVGQFELRKWASNNPKLLSHLPPAHCLIHSLSFDDDNVSCVKILGLQWNPPTDDFSFGVSSRDSPCTKRNVLSLLARIFDPLGFLTPVTFSIKSLLQKLWSINLGWDDTPPLQYQQVWNIFQSNLPRLQTLKISRLVIPPDLISCTLHGFSDASELGYAAVIYLRCIEKNQLTTVHFISARSRVAPMKQISIPRLELCGALLLANLMDYTLRVFQREIVIENFTTWTDSTIVISWLNSSPHRWCTFVANRITQIQEKIPAVHWRHIRSHHNPADLASRGLSPQDVLQNELWWTGPPFLQLPHTAWPQDVGINIDEIYETTEERKSSALIAKVNDAPHLITYLLDKFSSLGKVQRILAYVLRFVKLRQSDGTKRGDSFVVTPDELELSLQYLVKYVQSEAFANELILLKQNKPLPKVLRKLTPFLDSSGILRVGGRLPYSSLPLDQKHPILLPHAHRFTHMIIEHTHVRFLHPGLQTVQHLLLQRYWILSPKRAIRKVLAKCLKCFRIKPQSHQPIMGNLPLCRISQVKPFVHTGVDMAGPINITLKRLRGARVVKAWICVFVCMTVKAVHIELCSDLTSECFIAALRRFISRRGRCDHIYCDSGTNFIGASTFFKSLDDSVAPDLALRFHINCPKAPNFGGLWESQIKVMKSHLFRVLGTQILTYEELNTLLIQIESIMNSRPLGPLSSDANDLQPLTPGHFLTLEPLNSPPEADTSNLKLSHLSRWQLIQQMHQSFWKRWHSEYLHTLLQRKKWTQPSIPIEIGTMVVIKDDLSPPLKWNLGRIIEVHPGNDGIVRVVAVKTTKGIVRRPVHKVCPLPNLS